MLWTNSEKDIIAHASSCRVCADKLPAGPKPIFSLHPQAKVALLSQAPGRIAHESGEAWKDPGGRRLRAWLGVSDESFFDPRNFAVLPLGLCYPGRGKSGDLPPRPECAPLWQSRLLSLMPTLKLKILIGGHAMRHHLGKHYGGSVTNTLKSWEKLSSLGYWPLPHPSPRNRAWLVKLPFFEREILPALKTCIKELLEQQV
ncbi:MAG: uracil-DNA glycosylase family protein [Bacteroidota bacterium]